MPLRCYYSSWRISFNAANFCRRLFELKEQTGEESETAEYQTLVFIDPKHANRVLKSEPVILNEANDLDLQEKSLRSE
jgi:hypothetical protein